MFFSQESLKKLESAVDQAMHSEFKKDEIMHKFHNEDWFDEKYYKRHILECVIRIHMNNELDANAVRVAAINNISAAKQLSYYLYDEFGHDEMFGQDLTKYGYSSDQIISKNAFPETWKLMGYLNFCVEKFGALPAVVWDWFLEYYGDKFNNFITQKAGVHMGNQAVSGAASHVAFDEAEDHSGMMTEMLSSVIKTQEDFDLAIKHINSFVPMVGEYFQAVRAETLS